VVGQLVHEQLPVVLDGGFGRLDDAERVGDRDVRQPGERPDRRIEIDPEPVVGRRDGPPVHQERVPGVVLDLDDVDRGILYALQRDARNTTINEIAEEVEVSPSTVRNRIDRLEAAGIIEGYYPKINYEKAAFPLHVLFICSAPAEEREELAKEALEARGVVDVREMLTGVRNLFVEAVATDTGDLTVVSNELSRLGFEIETSEILTNHYTRPWAHFDFNGHSTE
jgi:DNA-binding Lrp family transcriptional regulator